MGTHDVFTILLSASAFSVSMYGLYQSQRARVSSEAGARAQLFARFQDQYQKISSRFPGNARSISDTPEADAADLRSIRDYWEFCEGEWYITCRLHPELYKKLWDDIIEQSVCSALAYPIFRMVFLDLDENYTQDRGASREFWLHVRSAGIKRGYLQDR